MADHVGEQFGDYRLIRRLGGGSFGDVYLAEHIRDKTQVAVKVLKTDEEDIEAYINEIRALFHLRHENIVPLLDFGIKQKIPFFVMAYASNGTLRRFRGTKIPPANVVNLVRQIAEALQCAHDRRIIHRDVKPENVLLGPQFQVWLSDFGIAGVAHSTNSLNNQGKVGTQAYMSPEQADGEPIRASDQYSLGIMAYEWISGNRPLNHRKDDPSPLRELVPDLPAAIEEVIMTALAKDPKRRFASVRAFATALEQAAKAPTILLAVEPKRNDKVKIQTEPINPVPEVKKANMSAPPASSSNIVEPSNEKKTIGLDEPMSSIALSRVDKAESKLAANDEWVMRQADGSDLLGANNPRSTSIGIIYVAPDTDRSSILEAILTQDKLGRKQVAVVLPEKSRAFQRPVDFDELKNLRRGLKTEIILVMSGEPGRVEYARQCRFTVYISLEHYKSALRAEQPEEGNARKGLPLFNRRPELVPNANAPAPPKSFNEPASPSPPPFAVPVIPLSAPVPIVAVPSSDDDRRVKPLLTMLPLEQIVETEDNTLTPEQRAIQQENYRRLYAAFAQLAPAQQQLIRLRYGNGLRLVAIAELLEKPEGSVREMLASTLRQLRVNYEKTERGMTR